MITMLKCYYVEYINYIGKHKNKGSKIVQHVNIFGINKKEVDIVINFLYPLIVNSDDYTVGTGFVKSESLEKEGKVTYLY